MWQRHDSACTASTCTAPNHVSMARTQQQQARGIPSHPCALALAVSGSGDHGPVLHTGQQRDHPGPAGVGGQPLRGIPIVQQLDPRPQRVCGRRGPGWAWSRHEQHRHDQSRLEHSNDPPHGRVGAISECACVLDGGGAGARPACLPRSTEYVAVHITGMASMGDGDPKRDVGETIILS